MFYIIWPFILPHRLQTKPGKSAKFQLGVSDVKIGQALKEGLSIECIAVGVVPELIRGIRTHFVKMLKSIKDDSLEKAQLGLGHRYVTQVSK